MIKQPLQLLVAVSILFLAACKEDRPFHNTTESTEIFSSSIAMNCLAFRKGGKGVVAGPTHMMYTKNGGLNWHFSNFLVSDTIHDLAFTSDTTVMAFGQNRIYYSENGGKSFAILDSDLGATKAVVLDSNRVLALKTDSALYLSNDYGYTSMRVSTGDSAILNFDGSGDTIAVYMNHDTLLSTNGGMQFNPYKELKKGESIAAGHQLLVTSQHRYNDSIWRAGTLEPSGFGDQYFEGKQAYVLSPKYCVAYSNYNVIASSNGGKNWDFLFHESGASFRTTDMTFASDTLYILESATDLGRSKIHTVTR